MTKISGNEVMNLVRATAPVSFLEQSAMGIAARKLAEEKHLFAEGRLTGRTVGSYKIEKHIAAGGMGEVYLAVDSKFYRQVALKILPSEYTTDDERLKRFELEAHAISCINHPNIVTIFDVGSVDGINFIATELVEGKDLHEAAGQLSISQILDLALQVCDALTAAHRAGIIHRDIKPQNIRLRPDGYVKVLDFGLAKLSNFSQVHISSIAMTAEGVIMGTPSYMSPEQIAGERVDYRTDLWSLGVILFELLTGKNPFKGPSRQATFRAILDHDPASASSTNPDISTDLDAILAKALKKDADARYQTAVELGADLKRVRRKYQSTLSGKAPTPTVEENQPRKTRKPVYAAAGAAALLIAATVAIFLFQKQSPPPETVDWRNARSVQLTDNAGTEYFPVLAPDAKTFIYAADQNGNFDIFSKRVGGGAPVNLTVDSKSDDTQPAISPDGESIVFRSEREPRGIYLMKASGENPRRITDFGYHPSWSPSGKEIVVSTFGDDEPTVRRSSPRGIWIVDIASGARREVSKRDASFPTWSPTGKHIAFWFYPGLGGRRDIAVIPAEGGKETVITTDFGVSNWNPVWSPDGKFIYFISDRNGNVSFWRVPVNPENGQPVGDHEAVVTPSTSSRHLNFSRDGKRIIYVQSNNQANIQAVNFDPVAGSTVGQPFWITTGEREVSRAELSPDGREFIMRHIRRTQDDIVVYNRTTDTWTDLTRDAFFDRYPRWSPDGRKVAFVSDRNGNYEIWISAPDGSGAEQVTFVGESETGTSFPTWSPSGKQMIYTVNRRSFIIDLEKSWSDQEPKPLPMPPDKSIFVAWDWSPDGKTVAGTFSYGKRGVGTYSFETGEFKRIADIPDGDPLAIPSWLPDSRHVVYRKDKRVFLADVVANTSREVFIPSEGDLRSPFVSRDGKLLYYVVHNFESDVWLLDASQ